MPIVAGFLKHTVTWEARVSEDEWGNPTYGTGKDIPALVNERSVLVNPAGGRERLQETTVMVGPKDDIQLGDRISGDIEGRSFEGNVQGRSSITLVDGKLDGYTLQL